MSEEAKLETIPVVGEEKRMPRIIPGQGMPDEKTGVWDCTDEQYYSDITALSCSMMKRFKESPRLFEASFITNTAPTEKKTDALLIGNAFHDKLLRPEAYAKNYTIQPKFGRKKAEIEAKARWEEENASKLVLTENNTALIDAMLAGLARNKMISELINHPERKIELAARWQVDLNYDIWEHHTDRHRDSKEAFPQRLVMKAKYDIVVPGRVMIDIKTIGSLDDLDKVARHFADYGYHFREQWYSMGAEATGLVDPHEGYEYLFVGISKEFPHDCVAFNLNESFGHLARIHIDDNIRRYAGAVAEGQWRHAGESELVTLKPPRYLFNADANS